MGLETIISNSIRTISRQIHNIAANMLIAGGIICGLCSCDYFISDNENSPDQSSKVDNDAYEADTDIKDMPKPCKEGETAYYRDNDQDDLGDDSMWICASIPGFVANNYDCDDNDPNTKGFDDFKKITNHCPQNFVFDENPLWSPAENRIAFIRRSYDPNEEDGVHIIDTDGKKDVQVSNGDSLYIWNETGDTLLIARTLGNWYYHLYSVNSDGSTKEDFEQVSSLRLINLFYEKDKIILATQDEKGEFTLKYLNGGKIFSTELEIVTGTYMSPDNKRFIILSYDKSVEEIENTACCNNSTLQLYDTDKNEFRTLTDIPYSAIYNSYKNQKEVFWLPDNKHILFSRLLLEGDDDYDTFDSQRATYLCNVDSGTILPLFDKIHETGSVLYLDNNPPYEVKIMKNVGGQIVGVTKDGKKLFMADNDYNLVFTGLGSGLEFTDAYLYDMAWSPDGKKIAMSQLDSGCGYVIATITTPCSTNIPKSEYWYKLDY